MCQPDDAVSAIPDVSLLSFDEMWSNQDPVLLLSIKAAARSLQASQFVLQNQRMNAA
jgi:hypothetical protein